MMRTRKWMLAAGVVLLCASVMTLSTIAAGPPREVAPGVAAEPVQRGAQNAESSDAQAEAMPSQEAGHVGQANTGPSPEARDLGLANTEFTPVVQETPAVASDPNALGAEWTESSANMDATTAQPSQKMVSGNSGQPSIYVVSSGAPLTEAYGSRGVGFDGSPGLDAPPPLLGGFPMTPFEPDTRPLGSSVADIPVPAASGCTGDVLLAPNMDHNAIGSGWATWSHGYTGDVYTAYAHPGDLVMTMPADTCAVYFYVEPNTFTPAFAVECVANMGLATEVSSGQVLVLGDAGATYFGFFASSPDHIETVTVIVDPAANGFAVGEFGIICGPDCVTEPVACCDDVVPSCVDQVEITDCMAQGGRFEVGVQYCIDLIPECGSITGACCCGPAGEAGVCEPYECIADMFGSDCLALGEETNWNPDESCDGIPAYECGAPTYCDAAGGTVDEYISRVQLGDIDNPSDQQPYSDFTAITTFLLYGVDYDITVTNGLYFGTDITSVWIDWNQDKDFADPDEFVTSGDPGGAIFTDTFQVAAGALAGPTRMRIRIAYGDVPDPCGTTVYGEVEDYTVIIGDPPPYGACCVEETCLWSEMMDEAACLLEGGVYQGDGSDCDPNPCIGACCYPDGECVMGVEADCLGDYLGDGTDCDPQPCPQPPPDCPEPPAGEELLFSQIPYLPDEAWTFGVSDTNFPYIRYENFSDINNDICTVTWWGAELNASFGACDRDPNEYTIAFFADNGSGQPDLGTEMCTWTGVPDSRDYTGYSYYTTNFPLWEYTVSLPSCCAVPPTGFISIQGVNDSGADCSFWGVSSPDGDLYHCGGPTGPDECGGANNYDFAMCLDGVYIPEWGACCFDEMACGDFDNNDIVDGADYLLLAGHMSTCMGDAGYDATYDLDGDGCVTLVDYQMWLECADGTRTADMCEEGAEKGPCLAAGGRFAANTACADLDPLCGNPGACCYDDVAGGFCLEDNAANCGGRFIPGGVCSPDPFDPPCGDWVPAKVLYAPCEADNPGFRAEVAAVVGDDVDYYDARIATPTLAELLEYKAVFTWVNYAYFDNVAMGDVLADYLEAGGRVILGQWCLPTAGNFLSGRIMTDYVPVEGFVWSSGTYAGDGVMCPHYGVGTYESPYRDECTLLPGNLQDGTFTDGFLSVAYEPAMRIFYSTGNTGLTYSTGDWGLLTGNIVNCVPGPQYGACCDPATGICEENVEVLDCLPLQWTKDTLCADLAVPCGNPGACCDITTAECFDDVLELNCDLGRFEPGEECAELNPECGTPGCCCFPEDGMTPQTPYESLEANCEGRFLPGVTGVDCVDTAFEPPCGLFSCEGILYAPSNADNAAFRAEVAAITGQPCDYLDTSVGTPTVEDMENYCCVMTWGNYAYADAVGFGNNLADYVDGGGKVILGQWTYCSDQANCLDGAIMGPDYCPVTTSTAYSSGAYAGDGNDCVHILGPVTVYDTQYMDVAALVSGAVSDGTFTPGGELATAWRFDRGVYYSPGNTGASFGTGQWAQLTANMCDCSDAGLFGACCDPYTGDCQDGIEATACLPPLEFSYQTACADLDPPCGNAGCCCENEDGVTPQAPYETLEVFCEGRFLGGVTGGDCVGAAFEPECGLWVPTKMLYAPAEADNPGFRAEVAAVTGSEVDYYDARIGTPTVEEMSEYAAVFTWVNYALFDNVAMGDNLADYLEAGGRVILGQWCLCTAGNCLSGRIMTDYCPVSGSTWDSGTYAGDGAQCPHIGVTSYESPYRDHVALLAGNLSDGTFTDGVPAVSFTPAMQCFYTPGNTGLTYSTGDWGLLTGNIINCEPGGVGACCDRSTGTCVDGVEVLDCLPNEWWYETLCADIPGGCGNPGACCDIYTSVCDDLVFEDNCEYARFEAGEVCVELNPECGTPGCCCENEDGMTPTAPFESLEANCDGRFLPGVTGAACEGIAFEPECGLWTCEGILYAPANADNPPFRDAVAAITGQPVVYWDTSLSIPTLADMETYCCVLTWGNYAYADPFAFGDNLADYVDGGGKVMLGQWTYHTTQVNWLEGRIMEPEYCPITATGYTGAAYAGDGGDCVHILGPVTAYDSSYFDIATAIAGAVADGTTDFAGDAVVWRADRKVYYTAGNTGGSFGTGDWAQLTANMCDCSDAPLFGACCDPTSGICTDDVAAADCQAPLQFTFDTLCADLATPCGNPGCCCDEDAATAYEEFEVNCEGRFEAGVVGAACDAAAFIPPCGEYTACEHSITMWDDYGDGWNGGFIDVYVGGILVLPGVTVASGSGPETVYFDAGTGEEIMTVWTAGGWPYECSYCIYDTNGAELGCDGMGGVDPTGTTVLGNCEAPPIKRPKRGLRKSTPGFGGPSMKAFGQ